MQEASLKRYGPTVGYCLGIFHAPGLALHTIEPAWEDNEPNISCIPPGRYECIYRKSPRFGWCYWLQETAPRSYILIHSGNLRRHTKGCIIAGSRLGWIGKDRAVLVSRPAIRKIAETFKKEPFWLEIS